MAKALLAKERSQAEVEFSALMISRLDSTEKENAFLKYEFNAVERELRIRNEEMEYYRSSADLLQKQHLESVQRIMELEKECQRLCAPPVRKRLNGPQGTARSEARRRNPNPSRDLVVVRESATKISPDASFLVEKLRAVEEENEALKKFLSKKTPEMRFSKSGFDFGSDDGISSSGSWATYAPVSEFEHFKNGRHGDFTNRRAADISLMDDFVEMEKLAIVSSEGKPFDWLQIILSTMLEQKHVSKRSLKELLEDIKIALGFINSPKKTDPPPISGYLTWKSSKDSPIDTSPKENCDWGIQYCSLRESIGKIIKLIQDQKTGSATSADYYIRVFQWRNSELNDVLERFVQTCGDQLNGGSDLERFTEEIASTLDWILNNYVTPKEAANARDKIKKHFGLRGENGESESSGITLEEENSRLRDELKSVMSEKADIEARLNSLTEKSENLVMNLQESRKRVGRLEEELNSVKGAIEDQIEREKLISDDLDTELSVAKAKLGEVLQKVSSLEVELEDKRNCCEELEATCLELQLQLESNVAKETRKDKTDLEEKQSQSGWEITNASAKLAECQETIVSLGKQLKALATPREAAILDSVFSEKDKSLNKRLSLRDRMIADDGAKAKALVARKVKETVDSSDAVVAVDSPAVVAYRSLSCKNGNGGGAALAIVASKRKGGGFDLLKKLLVRKKRSNNQKSRF